MTERIAAIDCGTNTIRLLVSELDGSNKTDLAREMRVVRLGQDVDRTGMLAEEAIERTVQAVREYAGIIEDLDVTTIRFCATSAARDAANGEDFASAVDSVLGVRPVVLTGEQEAQTSFRGAAHEFGQESAVLIDIGGGSSELISGRGEDAIWSTSADIGSVRMTERYLLDDPPTGPQISQCKRAIDDALYPIASQLEPAEALIGVAGTVTTMAAFVLELPAYERERIHRARLSLSDVSGACLQMAELSVGRRRALPFMHPGRADVIGAGALILDRLVHVLPLSTDQLVVSEHDILDGIVLGVAS